MKLIVVVALGGSIAPVAQAQESGRTAVETRVGPIALELGVPTEESSQRLYDGVLDDPKRLCKPGVRR
jgi:hypothetical protein